MKMTQKELNEILEKHQHWLLKDVDGWVTMRADLSGAKLSGANLCGVNLKGANLCRADLDDADLRRSNLSGANLFNADLEDADLRYSELSGANLHHANLRRANLYGANLYGATLHDATLYDANLYKADLKDALDVPYIPLVCPETGSFIGWKKARMYDHSWCIVKLEIPEDAKRLSATSRKCRCDKAKVLEIQTLSGEAVSIEMARSKYDSTFTYKVGEMVRVDDFDENRWNECSTGIHFFINRQESVDY